MMRETFKQIIKEFHEFIDKSSFLSRELSIPFNSSKIIVIYGARRTGKTFYFFWSIKELIKKGIKKERIVYVNFEDDRLSDLRIHNLNDLIEAYYELYPKNLDLEVYFFFDEIQNLEKWELFIRRINDTRKVKIFITGSSAKLLSKEISTSLRGRCLSYNLFPFSFNEFLTAKGIAPEKDYEYSSSRFKIKRLLEEYLEYGSFPEIALTSQTEIKRKILKEYYDSLIYKDLVDRFSVKNTNLLKELIRYLLTNCTKEFSVNSYFKFIKNSIPVSRETIIEYLNYIQETSYFYLLNSFSYSLKSQSIKPKKIISLDNGLRNLVAFNTSEDIGKKSENLVGINLLKQSETLFYWKDKYEVDFVVADKGGNLNAINVTYGERIHEREYKSLLEFKSRFKKVKKLIIISKNIETKEEGVSVIPLWKWLLTKRY